MQPDKKPYVFISHASGDVKAAREIVAKLRQHGITTWLAPDDVQPGREFSVQLEEAIASCLAFVVLMSDKANASAFVRAETELAFGNHDIFPVRIADVQPAGGLALFLRLKHWTDAFGPDREANLTRLAESIKRMSAADEEPSPPQHPPLPKPQPLLIIPEPDPSRPLEDDEATRIYIGDKAPHFLEKWRRMDARKSVASFNLPAFFFGPFWLFYRKIFKPGMIVTAAAFVLTTFGSFGQAMGEKVILALVQVISLGVAISIGVFGNQLYRRHVAEHTALLNRPGSDPQLVRDKLVMSGGTSPGAAIGLVAGLIVANFIVIAMASKCCSRPPDPVPYEYPATPATEPASPAAIVDPTPPSTASEAVYSVCLINRTSSSILYKVNPAATDSMWKTIAVDEKRILSADSAQLVAVRFESDISNSSIETEKNVATKQVEAGSDCGLVYLFSASGNAISLD